GPDGTPDTGRTVHHPIAPWWADLGTWGAVGLIVLGVVAAVWMFHGLPGTTETPAAGYLQVAKVVAVGLVVAGTGLLGAAGSGRPAGRTPAPAPAPAPAPTVTPTSARARTRARARTGRS